MIKHLIAPSASTAWYAFPVSGVGTQADPLYWNAIDTVNGSNSSITVGDSSSTETQTLWVMLKLTASTAYTFSQDSEPWMTVFTIYDDSNTQVAQSYYDDMEMVWSLTYTPSTTGVYLMKIEFNTWEWVLTASVTPVPPDIAASAARTAGVLVSQGVDEHGFLVNYRSVYDAGAANTGLRAADSWVCLHFDGNLADASPTARTNITSSASFVTGKFDNGISLTGNNNVTIPWTNNPFATAFTIQCWVKPLDTSRMCVVAAQSDCWIGIDNCNSKWSMWAGNGSWSILQADSDDSDPSGSSGIGTISPTTNQWQHLAYVHYDNQWVLFVDGVESRRKTRSGSVALNNQSIRLGVWGSDIFYSNLIMDEFRIDTTALWTEAFTPPDGPSR